MTLKTCSAPLMVECREAGSKVKAEKTGQTLTCDARAGLTCHNADNAERCRDYEIRLYCLCANNTGELNPPRTDMSHNLLSVAFNK